MWLTNQEVKGKVQNKSPSDNENGNIENQGRKKEIMKWEHKRKRWRNLKWSEKKTNKNRERFNSSSHNFFLILRKWPICKLQQLWQQVKNRLQSEPNQKYIHVSTITKISH